MLAGTVNTDDATARGRKNMSRLYYGGDILPMTGEGDSFEALVEKGGAIAFTGALAEARAFAPEAEEVDLEGACLMPGLVDPHGHLAGSNQYVVAAQLDSCASFDDIVSVMRAFAQKAGIGSDGIIMGVGYDQNALAEGGHPSRHVLDRVSTEIPCLAVHASSHMLVANSKLLELAGITAATPDPHGARYGREADGRTPDGLCEEPGAMWPVFAQVQPRQHFDMDDLIVQMQDVYLEHGITTCQEGATTADYAALFARMAKKGLLKLDVVSHPMYGEDVDEILSDHAEFDSREYTGHFRFGGLKMFFDGSPQGRTAWMAEPYTPGEEGEGYRGYGTISDEDAYAYMRKAIDGGHQLLGHTNGDAAADQFLRIYARALADSPNPSKGDLHPVMVHCQTARRDQYEQMSALNMIPTIFTNHIWYWGDVHLKNLGGRRGGRISAVRDAIDCGLRPTFHTDCPVLRPNLFESVWCAVKRETKNGVQLDEDQRIGVYEGLECITVNGARQYGEEDRKGTLEVGKLADFCIVERNPLTVPLDDLRNLRVLATIKEGEAIWRAR